MVQFFGRTEATDVRNGQLITVFRIPAFSEGMARRRANLNVRAKSLNNASIESIEQVAQGDLPGQGIYDATIISAR